MQQLIFIDDFNKNSLPGKGRCNKYKIYIFIPPTAQQAVFAEIIDEHELLHGVVAWVVAWLLHGCCMEILEFRGRALF